MKINYFILPLLFFVFCFLGSIYLFTIPGEELPTMSWLKIPYLDKYIHIGIFFTLCVTAATIRSRFSNGKITYLVIAIISTVFIFYGIGVEYYQENFVEGRAFELADILADSIGCLLFLVWFYFGGFAKKSWPL